MFLKRNTDGVFVIDTVSLIVMTQKVDIIEVSRRRPTVSVRLNKICCTSLCDVDYYRDLQSCPCTNLELPLENY